MASFFSKKCEYGLQAVLYLSSKQSEGFCSAEEISTELKIPKEFTSKVLQDLTEKGIIFSRKGREGGFKLALKADQIKLIDIIDAVDGLQIFTGCVLGYQNCSKDEKCMFHNEWIEIISKAYDLFNGKTINQFNEDHLTRLNFTLVKEPCKK